MCDALVVEKSLMKRYVRGSVAIGCLLFAVTALSMAQTTTPIERVVMGVEMKSEDNARRIAQLENKGATNEGLAAKIAVLEDNMSEIKWLARSLIAAWAIQLLVHSGAMRRKPGGEG